MLSIFLPLADPASPPVRGTGKEVFSLGPTWPVADKGLSLTSGPAPPMLAFGSWPHAAPTRSPVLMPRARTEPSRPQLSRPLWDRAPRGE